MEMIFAPYGEPYGLMWASADGKHKAEENTMKHKFSITKEQHEISLKKWDVVIRERVVNKTLDCNFMCSDVIMPCGFCHAKTSLLSGVEKIKCEGVCPLAISKACDSTENLNVVFWKFVFCFEEWNDDRTRTSWKKALRLVDEMVAAIKTVVPE